MKYTLLIVAFSLLMNLINAQQINFSTDTKKPLVWIYSDMSNPKLQVKNNHQTINDPDDVSAMAGYLLMSNMFDTRGIVISSTHREEHKTTPNQLEWVNGFFTKPYSEEVKTLNKNLGGYQESFKWMQSCIKETSETYNPDNDYQSLKNYSTIKALYDELEKTTEVINVLCWGSVTEPAILVKHLLSNKRFDLLHRLRFIAHWTNSSWRQGTSVQPELVANCIEDLKACNFVKEQALNGHVQYYECGAIGQFGIVSGAPKYNPFFNQFHTSKLGNIFATGKFQNGNVDHSDAATYWVLLGNWGVSLNDIANNGTNFPEIEKANEEKFFKWSERIHYELLRRSNAAVK